MPSSDDRFEVKVGKTLITWDGRLASDTTRLKEPVTCVGGRPRRIGAGGVQVKSRSDAGLLASMVGALKVEGKDDFAKALKASPTRFAGPAYQGGEGVVRVPKVSELISTGSRRTPAEIVHVDDVHNRSI